MPVCIAPFIAAGQSGGSAKAPQTIPYGVLGFSGGGLSLTNGLTRALGLFSASLVTTANRGQVQLGMTFAGTIRNLFVTTSTTNGNGRLVLNVCNNGSDNTLEVAISAGATANTFSDTAHSFAFIAGDLIDIRATNEGTNTTATIQSVVMACYPTTGAPFLTGYSAPVSTVTATEYMAVIPGGGGSVATESAVQSPMPFAAHAISLAAYARTLNAANGMTMTLRKAGVDTALAVTATTTSLAWYSANGSVAFATGDLAAISLHKLVSSSGELYSATVQWTDDNTSKNRCIVGAAQIATVVTASVTRYVSLTNGAVATALDATTRFVLPGNCTLSDLTVTMSGTQVAADLTYTVQINGVDTTLIATVPSGSIAGTFSDTTHTVNASQGQLLSIKQINAAALGNTLTSIQVAIRAR